MVFFTCNACGQSVKKNQVEKHYRTECRNCEYLSCLDCGTDFYGDDYVQHTSCVSEAQKYQGKLYKMPEGGASKGERKQKQWLERVSSITCASPRLQNLFDRLSTFANIPRKETKFQNFAKNSLKIYDRETLQELWRVFSAANDTTQVAAAGAASITESSKDEKKKGQKRKTHETGEETDSKRPDLDTEDVADEKSPPANSSKFRWSKAIVSVLQQTEDHTLPVKKLRKKVLAEFRHRTGTEMTKKDQIELFMRKLGKTKKLRVEKNQVMFT